jgi:1-aminocyclopropane-1-carboxylate deaminase/D-cysteine desulfhydrase-like pyridoxal-dependent ACC family enzyme
MPKAHLSRAELKARIEKLPRVRIAHLPTPLEEMPRLSAALRGPGGAPGPRILVKREDLTGLAFGGNKARHYEFEMAHIRDEGYDSLINIMDYHSNNARMTAAAANKMGMRYVLVLKNAKGRPVQGNLLIDKLLGAELHLLDEKESDEAHGYALKLQRQIEREGRKVYLLQDHLFPRIVGMAAFVLAGLELQEQLEELDIRKAHVFGVAGRSLCGLVLTAKNLGLDWKFTGVTVTYDPTLDKYIFAHDRDIKELLELPVTFDEKDITLLDQYVGEGYGIMTPEVAEAIHLAAQTDAIITDPNYTGTVMAALIDQVRKGNVKSDENVVFLHTGGLPAVFTFAEELAAWEG